ILLRLAEHEACTASVLAIDEHQAALHRHVRSAFAFPHPLADLLDRRLRAFHGLEARNPRVHPLPPFPPGPTILQVGIGGQPPPPGPEQMQNAQPSVVNANTLWSGAVTLSCPSESLRTEPANALPPAPSRFQ